MLLLSVYISTSFCVVQIGPPLLSCLFLRLCRLVPSCWRLMTGEEECGQREVKGIRSGRNALSAFFWEAFPPGPETLELPCMFLSPICSGVHSPRSRFPGCTGVVPPGPSLPSPTAPSSLCLLPSQLQGARTGLEGGAAWLHCQDASLP